LQPLGTLLAVASAAHVLWTALRIAGLPYAPAFQLTRRARWAAAPRSLSWLSSRLRNDHDLAVGALGVRLRSIPFGLLIAKAATGSDVRASVWEISGATTGARGGEAGRHRHAVSMRSKVWCPS